jgi:hypothetical protein
VGCLILALIYIRMEGLPDTVSHYFDNEEADIILRSTSRAHWAIHPPQGHQEAAHPGIPGN